jgi:hypothetical protein
LPALYALDVDSELGPGRKHRLPGSKSTGRFRRLFRRSGFVNHHGDEANVLASEPNDASVPLGTDLIGGGLSSKPSLDDLCTPVLHRRLHA